MKTEKKYFEKINIISEHATKLNSYLQVLKVYAECEMSENSQIGNMYEILELAVKEIDKITEYC